MQKLRGRALEEIGSATLSCAILISGQAELASEPGAVGLWVTVVSVGMRSWNGEDGEEVQPVHRSSFLTWSLSIKERGAFAHH